MRRTPSFLMFLTIVSVLTPAVALAQMTPPSEPTSRATVTGATSGSGRGFGLGTVAIFAPNGHVVPNLLGTWGDAGGRFHVEGIFGLLSNGSTEFDLGARAWYHVHAASAADFSLGAGFSLVSWRAAPANRQFDFGLDLGAQMRVFIVPNVALMASLGLGLYIPDSGPTAFTISGNIVDSIGLAYYFM
ncbi:MAG: hypothetical protein WCG85_09370 [Polyangia bacterium]